MHSLSTTAPGCTMELVHAHLDQNRTSEATFTACRHVHLFLLFHFRPCLDELTNHIAKQLAQKPAYSFKACSKQVHIRGAYGYPSICRWPLSRGLVHDPTIFMPTLISLLRHADFSHGQAHNPADVIIEGASVNFCFLYPVE